MGLADGGTATPSQASDQAGGDARAVGGRSGQRRDAGRRGGHAHAAAALRCAAPGRSREIDLKAVLARSRSGVPR